MISSKLHDLTGQLKNIVEEHKAEAHKALLNLPEGKTKTDLTNLLRKAGSGNVSQTDAQRELYKIIKNAG